MILFLKILAGLIVVYLVIKYTWNNDDDFWSDDDFDD